MSLQDMIDSDEYLCHGCGRYMEILSELCPCGVCPNCCYGDLCETKIDKENPSLHISNCGHCGD